MVLTAIVRLETVAWAATFKLALVRKIQLVSSPAYGSSIGPEPAGVVLSVAYGYQGFSLGWVHLPVV